MAQEDVVLPYAVFEKDFVRINNIRHCIWKSVSVCEPRYYSKKILLKDIEEGYFFVEKFAEGFDGLAHTFVSFKTKHDDFIAISVGIRKKGAEEYSGFKGLFNHFELKYTIADERDIVWMRSNLRKDVMYMYPITVTKENL